MATTTFQTIRKFGKELPRYRKYVVEFTINLFSFSILIVLQQLMALPLISRYYEVTDFGNIILLFGISNIFTSTVGFSIGNSRLLDQKVYNKKYTKLLHRFNSLVVVVSLAIYMYFYPSDYVNGVAFAAICLLGSLRLFFISEFRLYDEHKKILNQNIYYGIGLVLGTGLFLIYENWLLMFLLAEVSAVTYSFFKFGGTRKFFNKFNDASALGTNTSVQLMMNNGVAYSLGQYDRFIIYPILGPLNVSLYYAATISAKMGGLVMNPLSNYFLGKLSNVEEVDKRVVKSTLIGSVLIMSIYFVLTLISTPIILSVLYPTYLASVVSLILPISAGAAIMAGIGFVTPLALKLLGATAFNKIYIVYGIVLVISSFLAIHYYGLLGLSIAYALSGFTLLIVLIKKMWN